MKIKKFYQTEFISAISSSLITPFIPMYAISLGATKTLIGLLSAIVSFSSLISQLFWSALVESTKRKNLFIVLGHLIWALFWIPIGYVKSIYLFIALLAIQSALSSQLIPAWKSLLVTLIPKHKRGVINSQINLLSNIGSFIGSIVGGIIIKMYGFNIFFFYIISMFGIMSSLPFLKNIKEEYPTFGKKFKSSLNSLMNTKLIKENKKYTYLLKTMIVFNFSVSIASPMFSVYILQDLHQGSVALATMSAISTASAIIFYRAWGVLVDYLGRKTVMMATILPISFFPLVYYLSNNITILYLYEIIGSMSWGGFNIALFSYISDIIPKESSPTFLSIYNFITGSSSVLGSMMSGFLSDVFGIKFVFLISFILRSISISLFESLGEKKGIRPVSSKPPLTYNLISYRIENFVTVYTNVVSEARRNTVNLVMKKLFRSLS